MKMKLAGLFSALTLSATLAGPLAAQDAPVITDMATGNLESKVTVVEYASFTCPHCANFHAEVFSRIKPEYIDTGLIKFEYHEVYFDRYGLWAAMLARCGDGSKYFPIIDVLFDKQREWAGSEDPTQVVENLKTIGRSVGMEDAAMDICLKDQPMAEALVAHFEANMAKDQVEGTPTFFINGVKHSNMSFDEMKALLDAELAK